MIALSTTREGELLICVILYLDKTWLTKSGQRTAKPLSLTLGNFPRAVYNTNAAKRLICQVPEFPCAKADIQKDKAARGPASCTMMSYTRPSPAFVRRLNQVSICFKVF